MAGKYGDRSAVLRLMAEAPCAEATAKKAILLGPDALRGLTRERVVAAAERLGITLGGEGDRG